MKTLLLFTTSLLMALPALTCMTATSGKNTNSKLVSRVDLKKQFDRQMRREPTSDTSAEPYGGTDEAKLKIEARLAQIFDETLKKYENEKTLQWVKVAVPLDFQRSNHFPFGDKQSNARPSWGKTWPHAEPPVVGILQRFIDGQEKFQFELHPSLVAGGADVESFQVNGDQYWKVQPRGWGDFFVLNFSKMRVYAVEDMYNSLPENKKFFKDGRPTLDPEQVTKNKGQKTPYDYLISTPRGPGYNEKVSKTSNVHGKFPKNPNDDYKTVEESGIVTAVGGVSTWFIKEEMKDIAPFKVLYTCFDARNLEAEKEHGVPSGAGWHQVGDAAETVLNSLETLPVLVAVAEELPREVVGTAGAAHQLNHVAIAQRLLPNEGFMTSQNQLHWYTNAALRPICTEIWVHSCVPSVSNQFGFQCQ